MCTSHNQTLTLSRKFIPVRLLLSHSVCNCHYHYHHRRSCNSTRSIEPLQGISIELCYWPFSLGHFSSKLYSLASFKIVLLQVFLGSPPFPFPYGFHPGPSPAMLFSLFSACRIHFHFISVICKSIGFGFVVAHRSVFDITSGHLTLLICPNIG
jgi:hypothetical protein